ncbi:MAG: S9 family peptidase [Candidatus Eremiobacteraeota bacterium]|nr:S9 family peptidase [Candidatus Eremiobacteraeota bacterium]
MTSPHHGADPFAYLENAGDPATIAWTAEQNARTRATLGSLPGRAALEKRFDELVAIDSLGTPVACGERTFYSARRGRATQPILFVREHGRDRAILDPAALDPSGLTAVDWWYPSPAGTYVAFGLSTNGDERSTLGVLEVASGIRRPESIPDTRYCSVAWYPDEDGFHYVRFPPGADYGPRVYAHALGEPYARDVEIFGAGRAPEDMLGVDASADGRWLVVRASRGWSQSDAYLADTKRVPLAFVPLAEGRDALFDALPTDARTYVRTNDGAARYRIFAVDPERPERERWEEIVPEGAGTIDAFAVTRHGIVVHELEDVRSVVRVRRHDGSFESLAGFGERGLIGLSGNERDDAVFALAASFLDPPAIARIVVGPSAPAETTTWERVAPPFDASAYRVAQEWFVSKDGTRVPMWIVERRDAARDGGAPAVLYGYGGFNVSLTPSFSPSLAPWLDAGGVYAIANLRGGGEFGEAWHRDGMREAKQNVFDDFAAAVEYLGTQRIADPHRIAVYGGSNGGLLVAALAVQRPELAAAVVCAVPLTDMLRYHLFSIGRLWISEYGDPDVAAAAAFLRAYSPYHNVRDGVAYPATFIETAESDGRVDPLHAKKFGARLQEAMRGDAPVLVHVEQNAGHGAGKPRDKIVAELADRWGFISWRLGQSLV